MVILIFMAPSLPDIYKKEIDVFFNKLASLLLQNSKYNHAINLKKSKISLQMPLYNLL